MAKAKKKSRTLKSNISNNVYSHRKSGNKKAREIKPMIIFEQLDKLKRKGVITEKQLKNRKKQIFGSNNKESNKNK